MESYKKEKGGTLLLHIHVCYGPLHQCACLSNNDEKWKILSPPHPHIKPFHCWGLVTIHKSRVSLSHYHILFRQMVSKDERIKSGLDFLYDAPPGYDKGDYHEYCFIVTYYCCFRLHSFVLPSTGYKGLYTYKHLHENTWISILPCSKRILTIQPYLPKYLHVQNVWFGLTLCVMLFFSYFHIVGAEKEVRSFV